MLNYLFIKNFKSWSECNLGLAPLTGLFGTNSSGKTSIVQLLLLLKQTVESPDRNLVLNLGDDKGLVSLGLFKDVITDHDTDRALAFSFGWDLAESLEVRDPRQKDAILFSTDELGFSAQVHLGNKGRLSVDALTYRLDRRWFTLVSQANVKKKGYKLINRIFNDGILTKDDSFTFKRTPGRVWDLPAPTKFYGFPDQVKAYYQNASFLADLELSLENLFSSIYYLGPLREHPKRLYTWTGAQPADMGMRGEKVVEAILASRQSKQTVNRGKGKKSLTLEECVAYWLKKLGLIYDFIVEEIAEGSNLYRVLVRKTKTSPQVLITDVGFGVSQILPVIALCYYVPPGSTIILEQPEIHLHPSVQAGLADIFIDAIQHQKIQIILESHSEHLLRRLQRRIAEQTIEVGETALYFCSLPENESKLTHLDVDIFGNIKNWPENFFGDDFGEIAAISKAALNRKLKNDTKKKK